MNKKAQDIAGFRFTGKYPFALPALPYTRDALTPHISADTLDYHHTKHHNAYVNNLNALLEKGGMSDLSLEEIIINTRNDLGNVGVFNNAAQVWNHTFYWHCMQEKGGGRPAKELLEQIIKDFESYEDFCTAFSKAALAQFGSGWAWLVWDYDQSRLLITKTSNADIPICYGQCPILTIDVWEHAYYLDYQNRRADYVSIFLNHLVNWVFAENNFINR
jgi:Fe-Mn family superoxide dismutase